MPPTPWGVDWLSGKKRPSTIVVVQGRSTPGSDQCICGHWPLLGYGLALDRVPGGNGELKTGRGLQWQQS